MHVPGLLKSRKNLDNYMDGHTMIIILTNLSMESTSHRTKFRYKIMTHLNFTPCPSLRTNRGVPPGRAQRNADMTCLCMFLHVFHVFSYFFHFFCDLWGAPCPHYCLTSPPPSSAGLEKETPRRGVEPRRGSRPPLLHPDDEFWKDTLNVCCD